MNTLAAILTIFALVLIETAIMMYHPRTKAGSVIYAFLFIPASLMLFVALLIVAQTGG